MDLLLSARPHLSAAGFLTSGGTRHQSIQLSINMFVIAVAIVRYEYHFLFLATIVSVVGFIIAYFRLRRINPLM